MSASASPALIPAPKKMKVLSGSFTLEKGTKIVCSGKNALEAGKLLAEYLNTATGFALKPVSGSGKTAGSIFISGGSENTPDEHGFTDEKYTIEVSASGVTINAKSYDGLCCAIQTLRQLFDPEIFSVKKVSGKIWTLPAVKIEDAPAYRWRGLHFDVARHFFTVGEVCGFIENMARHKLNLFHWHLTDDQGWRVEIKKYPKLTTIGSKRRQTLIGKQHSYPHTFDGIPHGGFYTQADLKKVVAFAARRGIRILPEIDMPGHMQAAVAAYPELGNNPSFHYEVRTYWHISRHILNPSPESISFAQDVIKELLPIFPFKYIHLGGDEAPKDEWLESDYANKRMKELGLTSGEQLQSYFTSQMVKFLVKHGRRMIGWDEIAEGGLPDGASVMNWHGTEHAVAAANAGHFVVNATSGSTYFDYYQADPETEPMAIGCDLPCEKVYRYLPVPNNIGKDAKKFILGGQGQVWTEYIPTISYAEYMAYPRACALAERLWYGGGLTFKDFLNRLAIHRVRLGNAKVNIHPLP